MALTCFEMIMNLVSGRLPWEFVNSKSPVRIAVVGDLILDEYLEGYVKRISPEAPVPVHLVKGRTMTAGGAANVARNIQLAGGQAVLFGVLGKDEAARSLKGILQEDRVDISQLVEDPSRPTIRKMRVTSSRQQMVRIDWEESTSVSYEFQQELLTRLKKSDCDLILLSDYAKGCLTQEFIAEVISYGKSSGKKVLVDPKGRDYHRYQGASLITPNKSEALEALGLDSLSEEPGDQLAHQLIESFGFESVLVTLGEKGMVGLPSKGSQCFQLSARTREVFDVSGAGDTVVGIMALAMGSGLELEEAMNYANVAAGLVVEKWGTQPVFADELKSAIRSEDPHRAYSSLGKMTSRKQLRTLLGPRSSRQKSFVFTNGCFDILHAGHVSYLEAARALGDRLVVAVNSDASLQRLKGDTRPIIPEDQRMAVLAGLGCVDYVVCFDEDTPLQIIGELQPDILVKGADYEVSEIVGADSVIAAGGQVQQIAFVDGLSTSNIIERIKSLN